MRYRAFFSYARADDRIANWLHRQLDGYRTPKAMIGQVGALGPVPAKLFPIYRDRTDQDARGHLDQRLQEALQESECLIVLCTPTSAKSHWVNHEVETFLKLGREVAIFPVIAAGIPNSDDPETECFPPTLRNKGLLAADLREIKLPTGQLIGDGREGGRLKLIAGLLGVKLDALAQRERQRQRLLVGVLAFGALIFACTAAVAVIQTGSAEHQARLAQAKALEAEQAALEAKQQRDLAVNRLEYVTKAPASVRRMLLELDFRARSPNSILYGFDGFDAPPPCEGNAACSRDASARRFKKDDQVAVTWDGDRPVVSQDNQNLFTQFCSRIDLKEAEGSVVQAACIGERSPYPLPSYSKLAVFELGDGWWLTRLVGWSCGSRGCEDVFVVWGGSDKLERALSCGGVSFAIRFDVELPVWAAPGSVDAFLS